MKYLYIELIGFKRFSLNNINRFAMTITEVIQLVLGTNGSGKSSLMEQITPLPALPADFTKQGSKLIRISHGQHIYTLKSAFYPSQKHSFLRGDEELNDGGTVTIQRELVKRHFGITTDIHELALGNECFTSMSPSRRKEWFIRLCDTNYDYAIRVYNKLKEKHRDCSGAIKLAKKRLVAESEKLIQDDEEKRLHKEATALYECLRHLTEYRKPVECDLDNLEVQQAQLDQSLIKAAKSLQAIHGGAMNLSNDETTLRDIISTADDGLARARTLIEKYTQDYQKNQKKIEALQKAEQQTIETIEVFLAALHQEKATLTANGLIEDVVLKPKAAMDALETVKYTLTEIYSTIPENKDRQYSQDKWTHAKEERAKLQTLKVSLSEKLHSKQTQLKHQLAHKDKPDLQCPGCHHKFSLNYSESSHKRLEHEIEQIQKQLETEVTPAIEQSEVYLQQFNNYVQLYRQYSQCVASWPILNPYWSWLNTQQVLTNQPSNGLFYLSQIEKDLVSQVRIEEIDKQYQDKHQLLISLRDVGGTDLKSLLEQNHELDEILATETNALRQLSHRKTQAQQDLQRLAQIKTLSDKVINLIKSKRECNKEQIETLRRTELNAAIRQLHSDLASREHVLSTLKQQKNIVEHVVEQIADLEKEEQALSILVKQLSPTEGLIAEGLFGFIRNFIHQMNVFIQKVWTYPLTIQSCSVDENANLDLDYRFPLVVQSATNAVPDVSKGSVGMKEIVNLAYRLTAMRYLGLQEYPLILDEWGGAMDETHRSQASVVIKSLVEQQACSQLFMVSHYFAQYGALANAEICVLNNLNITVPRDYNKHITMA